MPYYPEDQSKENIKKLTQVNVCKDCGRQLYAFLDRKSNQTYIACPTPGHEGIVREYQPQDTGYRSEIRREIELEKEHGRETAQELATIPKHGQLDQGQAMHILQLVYPKAPQEEIIRCAILCRDFGLHPLMKEVYLIPFNEGKPNETWVTVMGINATRKLMALRGSYSYYDDTPRLMTPEEQMVIYGEVDKFNVVAITKLRTKDGLEAPGYGRWPNDKQPRGTDKGNTKANMAFIRSERNAFGRLSPDALPPGVDIIDEAYTEVPDVGKVERETGEVIEGEVKVVDQTTNDHLSGDPLILPGEPAPEPEKEHWCEEHNCQYDLKKRGSAVWYAHKTEGGWCNEKDKKAKTPKEPTSQPEPEPLPEPTTSAGSIIDMDWVKESLKQLKWTQQGFTTFCTRRYNVDGGLLEDVLGRLTKEQQQDAVKEIQDRLQML